MAGRDNKGTGDYSFVGGGAENEATADYAVVVGGGEYGFSNTGNFAQRIRSFVGAGDKNVANGQDNFIGAGDENETSGSWSAVVCGQQNTTSDAYAFVGGGEDNTASEIWSTVGGGTGNEASSTAGAIIGGGNNTDTADKGGAIVGGRDNSVSGNFGAVGGGDSNTVAGRCATVPGGADNVARGEFSAAFGHNATVEADGAVAFADASDEAFTPEGAGLHAQMEAHVPELHRMTADEQLDTGGLDPETALDRLVDLDVGTNGGGSLRIDPEAFNEAFDLDGEGLGTLDVDAALVAAVQALAAALGRLDSDPGVSGRRLADD